MLAKFSLAFEVLGIVEKELETREVPERKEVY